jgi:hypothetical protein
MFRKSAFAAGVLLLASTAVSAHHPSGISSSGAAGPINTIGATTFLQGQSSASIMFEMVKMNPLSDAFLANWGATHGHDQHVHSLSSILAPAIALAYGVTNDLTVSARIPFVKRNDIREADHEHAGGVTTGTVAVLGDSAGVGDLTLLGQYRFLSNRATQLEAALLAGVKLPTGETKRYADTGELLDAEFQPGSGSTDGLFGLALTKRIGPWSLDANVLYVVATQGTQRTDLGDRFQYNAALSYRLASGSQGPMYLGALPEPMYHSGPRGDRHSSAHAHSEPVSLAPELDVVLELNGERHAKTIAGGVTDQNSGGNVVYLAPGLRFSMQNWSSYVSFGVPVVNELNGVQAEPDWRLLTGIAVSF